MNDPCMSCGDDRRLPAPHRCRHKANHNQSEMARVSQQVRDIRAARDELRLWAPRQKGHAQALLDFVDRVDMALGDPRFSHTDFMSMGRDLERMAGEDYP